MNNDKAVALADYLCSRVRYNFEQALREQKRSANDAAIVNQITRQQLHAMLTSKNMTLITICRLAQMAEVEPAELLK
jgi:hypothetical protein